jgi:hypothetical protein
VESWRFDKFKPVVFITYVSKYGHLKEYPYNTAFVEFLKNPKIVELDDRIALKGDSPLSGAKQLQFFGLHCRVVYKSGYRELVHSSSVRIVESAFHVPESRNCFEYLKQIAIRTGLVTAGHNILANSYEKIKFVRDDSVLAAFLSGKYDKEHVEKNTSIVYPFGFNLSQKKAVDNALCNPISIIEGPPGTGKTQTILNIIANAVMRGESVAVVSSNNSATANVLEKLRKYGVDFIAAPLGSSANREAFIESQTPNLPDMRVWRAAKSNLTTMREDELMLDKEINNKSGIYRYVLTGEEKALSIQEFDKKSKKLAYKSQEGRCKCCGEKFEEDDLEAVHIIPWRDGGKVTSDNCQLVCRQCKKKI